MARDPNVPQQAEGPSLSAERTDLRDTTPQVELFGTQGTMAK